MNSIQNEQEEMEKRWAEIYDYCSSNFLHNLIAGIEYHSFAYGYQGKPDKEEKYYTPWKDYCSRIDDFQIAWNKYQAHWGQKSSKTDGSLLTDFFGEDLKCLSFAKFLEKLSSQQAGQTESPYQAGKISDRSPYGTHLAFAAFLYNRALMARHVTLFRSSVSAINPREDPFYSVCRKAIMKPEYWRNTYKKPRLALEKLNPEGTRIKESKQKINPEAAYGSSSFSNWIYGVKDSVPPRDVVIQLCLQWKTGMEEANHILRCAGYASLYAFDPVDLICMYELDHPKPEEQPEDTLSRTKKEINEFLEKWNASKSVLPRKGSLATSGMAAAVGDKDIVDKAADLFSGFHGYSLYQQSREGTLPDVVSKILGENFANARTAGDYGLRELIHSYPDHPESYRKNLYYSRFDPAARRTTPIPSVKDYLGKNWEKTHQNEMLFFAHPSLRLAYLSLREKNVKLSRKVSVINTIMSFHDLISPMEIFETEYDEKGKHLTPRYVNAVKGNGKSSTACRILDDKRCAGVSKIELIRYMLAVGKEDEIGINLYRSGFWAKNYLLENVEFWEDEMDITDYILIYAMQVQRMFLGDRTADNEKEYMNFSMIALLMDISRNMQLFLCMKHRDWDKRKREDARTKREEELSPEELTFVYHAISDYSPYYVHLPRYNSKTAGHSKKDNGKDVADFGPGAESREDLAFNRGWESEEAEDKEMDEALVYPVPSNVKCSGWVADYELAQDVEQNNTRVGY